MIEIREGYHYGEQFEAIDLSRPEPVRMVTITEAEYKRLKNCEGIAEGMLKAVIDSQKALRRTIAEMGEKA